MDKRKEIIKYRFADPQRAYDICCELLEQGRQSGNDYEIAYAYLYMGDTLLSMGRLDEALKYVTMSEKVQKQNGFDNLLMKTYNITGIIYITMGDTLLAVDCYYLALGLAKKYGNYTLMAMVYNNVGSLLTNIGDAAKAAEYYRLSYEYNSKKGRDDNDISFSMIQLSINICEGYLKEKRYTQAKEYLDNALLSINRDEISLLYKMRIIHMYAMIYYGLEDYKKAYEMCMKVTMLGGQNWQDIEVFNDYLDITEVMVNTGHIDEVKTLLHDLDEIAEQTDLNDRRLDICRIRIQIYQKTGEKDRLNEQLQKYYRIKKEINREKNKIIISAINNRCRLEEERKQNRLLKEDNRKLVRESEIDELTGIYNRYAFKRRYDKLYRYAQKNGHTYCAGIFDIDYFKQYNDSYGHLRGDECLKWVARILRKTSDGDFCVARYGGDEFVFMAYGRDEDGIRDFVCRLIENIRQENIRFEAHPESDRVTISVGVILQDTIRSTELTEMLEKADKALYEVKQTGKNGYKICNLLSQKA